LYHWLQDQYKYCTIHSLFYRHNILDLLKAYISFKYVIILIATLLETAHYLMIYIELIVINAGKNQESR